MPCNITTYYVTCCIARRDNRSDNVRTNQQPSETMSILFPPIPFAGFGPSAFVLGDEQTRVCRTAAAKPPRLPPRLRRLPPPRPAASGLFAVPASLFTVAQPKTPAPRLP